MFSLIITIISIALVAALALATLYYGGSAFNKGSADAEASKIMLQSQQLLGAAELFKVEHGRWPADAAEMVSKQYLKSVPVAQGAVSAAQAAGGAWTTPRPDYPVYSLQNISPDVCKSLNKKAYGSPGILKTLREGVLTQCYGISDSTLQVVVGKDDKELQGATVLGIVDTAASTNWYLAPDQAGLAPVLTTALAGAPMTLGGISLSASSFNFPAIQPYDYAPFAVSLTNNSGADITINSLTSTSGAPFYIDGCYANPALNRFMPPPTLANGATCYLEIGFYPTSTGTFRSQFAASTSKGVLTMELAGIAGTPDAVIADPYLYLGLVFVNQTATRQTTITNSTSDPVRFSVSAPVTPGISASIACATSPVLPGGSCLLDVAYAPTTVTSLFETLVVSSTSTRTNSAGFPARVELSGQSELNVGLIVPSAGAIFFEPTSIGQSVTKSVTLTNARGVPADTSFIQFNDPLPQPYITIAHDCPAALGPNDSCTLTATFAPLGPTNSSAHVVFNPAQQSSSLTIFGKTIEEAVIGYTSPQYPGVGPDVLFDYKGITYQNTINLGTVAANVPVTFDIDFRNDNAVAINMTNIGFCLEPGKNCSSGNSTPGFTSTHSCPISLAPGATCRVRATFLQTRTGNYADYFMVTANQLGRVLLTVMADIN